MNKFRVTYIDPEDREEVIVVLHHVLQSELKELFPDFWELFLDKEFTFMQYIIGSYIVIIDREVQP